MEHLTDVLRDATAAPPPTRIDLDQSGATGLPSRLVPGCFTPASSSAVGATSFTVTTRSSRPRRPVAPKRTIAGTRMPPSVGKLFQSRNGVAACAQPAPGQA